MHRLVAQLVQQLAQQPRQVGGVPPKPEVAQIQVLVVVSGFRGAHIDPGERHVAAREQDKTAVGLGATVGKGANAAPRKRARIAVTQKVVGRGEKPLEFVGGNRANHNLPTLPHLTIPPKLIPPAKFGAAFAALFSDLGKIGPVTLRRKSQKCTSGGKRKL